MRIIGIGSALPALQVTNEDLTGFLDTSDEWISSRTGITNRRLLSDEKIEDLAAAAAKKALEQAKLSAADIDYVLCCNSHSPWMTPGLGCIVNDELGITAPSIDLNGACAGFIYALEIAQSLLASEAYQRILIVCAEVPSHMVDWTDRATCVLFGDAAAAVVLDGSGEAAHFVLGTEPGIEHLYAHNALGNSPYCKDDTPACWVQMNGQEVYRFAVSTATRGIRQLLEEQELQKEEVDFFLLHQANLRIVEAVRTRFKQEKEKFPTNIEECGNTLTASIPLLLCQLDEQGKLKRGDILALSAFGAGLTAGACLMKW